MLKLGHCLNIPASDNKGSHIDIVHFGDVYSMM